MLRSNKRVYSPPSAGNKPLWLSRLVRGSAMFPHHVLQSLIKHASAKSLVDESKGGSYGTSWQ